MVLWSQSSPKTNIDTFGMFFTWLQSNCFRNMAAASVDDLMDDLAGERPKPAGLDDPAPKIPWKFLWEDLHVEKDYVYCPKAKGKIPKVFCWW